MGLQLAAQGRGLLIIMQQATVADDCTDSLICEIKKEQKNYKARVGTQGDAAARLTTKSIRWNPESFYFGLFTDHILRIAQ